MAATKKKVERHALGYRQCVLIAATAEVDPRSVYGYFRLTPHEPRSATQKAIRAALAQLELPDPRVP